MSLTTRLARVFRFLDVTAKMFFILGNEQMRYVPSTILIFPCDKICDPGLINFI